MTARETIAHAITHAPPGVKGGPYEGYGEYGAPARSTRGAMRWAGPRAAEAYAVAIRKVAPHARVIRIVRARPSRLCDACGFLVEAESRRRMPSEASAVEVLRELVAYPGNGGDLARIQARARRVLAASGPDPSEVVRAAMTYWCMSDGPLLAAVDAYRKAGGK